jgi:hypothetical protein
MDSSKKKKTQYGFYFGFSENILVETVPASLSLTRKSLSFSVILYAFRSQGLIARFSALPRQHMVYILHQRSFPSRIMTISLN